MTYILLFNDVEDVDWGHYDDFKKIKPENKEFVKVFLYKDCCGYNRIGYYTKRQEILEPLTAQEWSELAPKYNHNGVDSFTTPKNMIKCTDIYHIEGD